MRGPPGDATWRVLLYIYFLLIYKHLYWRRWHHMKKIFEGIKCPKKMNLSWINFWGTRPFESRGRRGNRLRLAPPLASKDSTDCDLAVGFDFQEDERLSRGSFSLGLISKISNENFDTSSRSLFFFLLIETQKCHFWNSRNSNNLILNNNLDLACLKVFSVKSHF